MGNAFTRAYNQVMGRDEDEEVYDAGSQWGRGPFGPYKTNKTFEEQYPNSPLIKQMETQGGQGREFTSENRPRYESIRHPNGAILPEYRHQYSGDVNTPDSLIPEFDRRFSGMGNVNPTGEWFNEAAGGMGMLQDRAYGTDTSPWADKLYEQQAIQQWEAEQQLGNQQHQQYAMANDRLAHTGGLDSGARERLGEQAMRGEMMGRQGLAREGELQRLGIGINDEAQRFDLQKQLPGMFQAMDQYRREGDMYNDQMNYRTQATWADLAGKEYDATWRTDGANADRRDKINFTNTDNTIRDNDKQYLGDMEWWKFGAEVESADRLADATDRESARSSNMHWWAG